MVRFYLGEPQQLFLSEHAFGEVWPFDVISKGSSVPVRFGNETDNEGGQEDRRGKDAGLDGAMRKPLKERKGWEGRPVVYSAEGSHALYGTSGFVDLSPPPLTVRTSKIRGLRRCAVV